MCAYTMNTRCVGLLLVFPPPPPPPPGRRYIFQGGHVTTKGYHDTMDFAIAAVAGADGKPASSLRAFNVANIHGALGDHGQSYKTLVFMLKALGYTGVPKILHGCGKPILA